MGTLTRRAARTNESDPKPVYSSAIQTNNNVGKLTPQTTTLASSKEGGIEENKKRGSKVLRIDGKSNYKWWDAMQTLALLGGCYERSGQWVGNLIVRETSKHSENMKTSKSEFNRRKASDNKVKVFSHCEMSHKIEWLRLKNIEAKKTNGDVQNKEELLCVAHDIVTGKAGIDGENKIKELNCKLTRQSDLLKSLLGELDEKAESNKDIRLILDDFKLKMSSHEI